MDPDGPITLDTNIVIYALTDSAKTARATEVLQACAFLSVQVLSEYANVARRKRQRRWPDISDDLVALKRNVPLILPINDAAHVTGLRIAARYQLSFYDALMLAVALSGGARIFYSEDMQHGMTIDETLRVMNPFTRGIIED